MNKNVLKYALSKTIYFFNLITIEQVKEFLSIVSFVIFTSVFAVAYVEFVFKKQY